MWCSMRTRYDWKRYWHPLGADLILYDGLLPNPDVETGLFYNPEVVPLSSLNSIPCLAMLGEQGIGKSSEIDCAAASVLAGDKFLGINTGGQSSMAELQADITESAEYVEWIGNSSLLYMYLDSLDEGPLTISAKMRVISGLLKNMPLERLRLRIACRTASWLGCVQDELLTYWTKDHFAAYELAPLRRADVVQAACSEGVDADMFLQAVEDKNLSSLISKPLSLRLMLNYYKNDCKLPKGQIELMKAGCLILCKETELSRNELDPLSDLERLVIAERIAALTFITGKAGVWTGLNPADHVDEVYLPISRIVGKETIDSVVLEINEKAIRETLGSGLFVARSRDKSDRDKMGWDHQSYAEFLAAKYLAERLTREQVLSLLFAPDEDSALVPQLRGVGSWLVSLNEVYFHDFLKADPEVMLLSDTDSLSEDKRAQLTQAILERYDCPGLHPRHLPYHALKHNGLAPQLLAYIKDTCKALPARIVAIKIAGDCQVAGLNEELSAIALDAGEHEVIRRYAARSTVAIDPDNASAKLKPLALGSAGEDPDDELKGWGLRATWPLDLTSIELYSLLTPPKNPNLIGIYHVFCNLELPNLLRKEDLPAALDWVIVQPPAWQEHWCDKLKQAIFDKAWESLDAPEVLDKVTRTLIALCSHHEALPIPNDVEKKRRVLEEVIRIAAASNEERSNLLMVAHYLRSNDDLQWMLSLLYKIESNTTRLYIAYLLYWAADLTQPETFESIYEACTQYDVVREVFAPQFTVELGTKQAETMRKYYEMQKRNTAQKNSHKVVPSPKERVARCIADFFAGNIDAWWHLNRELSLKEDSTHYNDMGADITALPGWLEADSDTRDRIVEMAKEYLIKADPKTEDWLGTNKLYLPARDGFRALRLLCELCPDVIAGLESQLWRRWTPAIINECRGDLDNHDISLLQEAHKYASDIMTETILSLIDYQNTTCGDLLMAQLIEQVWDDGLADTVLDKCNDHGLKSRSLKALLGLSLTMNTENAVSYAESLVALRSSGDPLDTERAVIATVCLLLYSADLTWSSIWPLVDSEADFGEAVMEYVVAEDSFISKSLTRLHAEYLVYLYIWVVEHYPGETDFADSVSSNVNERYLWKLRLLNFLRDSGEWPALAKIKQSLKDAEWLNQIIAEARDIARRFSWSPPSPEDVICLATNANARYIQSERQLMGVLKASLRRLESKLHGPTSAVKFLWDKVADKKWRPKDENSFSDYVKLHLDEDLRAKGILVNREVEIRPARGAAPGERTDILVQAFIPGKHDDRNLISVIIESKGNWNRELETAMQGQLVERYLKENECQHGIYLVAWFDGVDWNDDYRRNQVPKWTLGDASTSFADQAACLSQEGNFIRSIVMDTALR